jgi:hypothetical protein
MFRKTCSLLVLLPAVLFFVAIGWSCIERTVYMDIYVKDIHLTGSNFAREDSAFFSKEATFVVKADSKDECCMRYMPFVSSCYATNVQKLWKNTLLSPSFHFSFDRAIMIDSIPIAAHANLLDNPMIKQVAFERTVSNESVNIYTLALKDSVLSRMQLDTLPYVATFSCTTSDGKPFSKQLVAVFKK